MPLFSPPVECLSEAVKMMKGELMMKAIDEHKMDRAIIFCRTKLDCDNAEGYLKSHGGGTLQLIQSNLLYFAIKIQELV